MRFGPNSDPSLHSQENSSLKIGGREAPVAHARSGGVGARSGLAYSMIDEFYPEWSNATQKECLNQLWQHESGWDHNALNPSSGACGIPQSLPCSKMDGWGFFYLIDASSNPYPQVMWGLEYIKSRPDYADPCEAWSLWQSRDPHWY